MNISNFNIQRLIKIHSIYYQYNIFQLNHILHHILNKLKWLLYDKFVTILNFIFFFEIHCFFYFFMVIKKKDEQKRKKRKKFSFYQIQKKIKKNKIKLKESCIF